ncbi:MAG: radical SAM protein [Bacillota bacterium]|nr:radical SAM protein [Bacillota bacterium]
MRSPQLPRIVQLEVTSACQLRCRFCPRTALADSWITTHLPWESFTALLSDAPRLELVHLQGWGEPLLHPRLWDMAAALKGAGCRVSLTTNAVLLDQQASREACRLGVDLVAISVAGARAATNDSLRLGSSLDRIAGIPLRLPRSALPGAVSPPVRRDIGERPPAHLRQRVPGTGPGMELTGSPCLPPGLRPPSPVGADGIRLRRPAGPLRPAPAASAALPVSSLLQALWCLKHTARYHPRTRPRASAFPRPTGG